MLEMIRMLMKRTQVKKKVMDKWKCKVSLKIMEKLKVLK